MSYELGGRLVVGVASSALFDLTESDRVFQNQGESAYRDYQERHLNGTLSPGVAFPFIKRLLSLNDLPADNPLVEVIVLSRNDPETGLRVMRSIEALRLPITRAVFMQGRSPYAYMPAFNMTLFLSANDSDVREAIAMGLPAGMLEDFHRHEVEYSGTPIAPGLMRGFLQAINRIQRVEDLLAEQDPDYNRRLHVSIVTARSAPAHDRVIETLKTWGVRVNDAFFLGGIGKDRVLSILRPHIFFDDQLLHVESAASVVPSVHVPFGIRNTPLP